MARLTKKALVALAVDAISANGWSVRFLSNAGIHTAPFVIEKEGVECTVRLYIWNLSHGGQTRSKEEFRIQVTGVDSYQPEPNGRTLILGWGEDFGVFVGFDSQRRLGAFGASPSIQIKAATLQAAGDTGAGVQDKGYGEYAIGLRPDRLGRYVQHLAVAHAGHLDPILAADDSHSADPLTFEINRLANDSVGFNLEVKGEDYLRAEIVSAADELLTALHLDEPEAGADRMRGFRRVRLRRPVRGTANAGSSPGWRPPRAASTPATSSPRSAETPAISMKISTAPAARPRTSSSCTRASSPPTGPPARARSPTSSASSCTPRPTG